MKRHNEARMLSGDVGNQMPSIFPYTHSGCVSIFVSGIMDKQGFSVDENFLEIKEGGGGSGLIVHGQ